VVLVHGFGASAYHWRYVVPELAKKYSVYAVDLLGFGMSSKPQIVYNGYTVWSDQLTAFINEVDLLPTNPFPFFTFFIIIVD
jgi:pimeloyl-ACP methyl ester carboxylesterase